MCRTSRQAFSLQEMLVALAVLAIIAVLIVATYQTLHLQAMQAVAQQDEDEFNKIIAKWTDLGGNISGNAYTSDVLDLLASSGPYSNNGISDSDTSPQLRMAIPPGAQTTTALGYQKRGVFTDGSQQFMANWNFNSNYMGVVPVINGAVPISYWGTGDGNRTIYHEAVGSTTTIIFQKADNIVTMYEPLTFSWNLSGGNAFSGSISQGIENGLIFLSSQQPPNIGPNPNPSMNCSIATFTNSRSGQSSIREANNISENFFGSSDTTTNNPQWQAALASLQQSDAPVSVLY